MTRIKLTDSLARKLPAPSKDDKESYHLHRDDQVIGFALRITQRGARSWTLAYRCHRGREHRMTLGSFPDWPTTAARERAKELKRLIDQGHCPVEDQEAERAAPTVNDLARRYLAEHARPRKRPGSVKLDEDMLKRWIKPELGELKVADIRPVDVERLHRVISGPHPRHRKRSGAPFVANGAVSLLRKMFNLAIKWEMRTDNPAKGIEKNPEVRRRRYMSGEELTRLLAALTGHPDKWGANAIRLLLLTGARRGEVLGATWDQFNFETGLWVKPGSTTKQKTEHRVPLSAPVRLLLAEMRDAATGDALFPGRTNTNLRTFWKNVCREAGLVDLRIHDLRHSFASTLVSSGLGLPVIGALLGHASPTTTSRYSHLFIDPQREAVERVGAIVTAAASGAPGAQVTELPKGNRRG